MTKTYLISITINEEKDYPTSIIHHFSLRNSTYVQNETKNHTSEGIVRKGKK
jgi:hypothetical protein